MSTTTKRPFRIIATVVVLVLMFATVAVAGPMKQLPFTEDLSGGSTGVVFAENFPFGETFDGRCSTNSQMLTSMAGTGIVTHMGRVSWTNQHCVQLFYGTFSDADLVITAANGDQLYGTFDGAMTSETSFAEIMTILGGTGRFAGASGVVSETGSFDPITFELNVYGEGWISYDASDRSEP
ncbi:MAG: hypothetical protein ABFR95_05765 [Actinomycetota bacterium]